MPAKYIEDVVEKTCELCGEKFIARLTKREIKRRFCCKKCAITFNGISNKGKVKSKELIDKLSKMFSGKNNPFYGKSHSEISKRKISESLMWGDDDVNQCEITQYEKEVIDGIMLADGHIEKLVKSSRITYGCKFRETLDDIKNSLENLNFSEPWQSKKSKCWHFKSKSYLQLNEYRNLWYDSSGTKIVPDNIKLTPIVLYWWFVGDGYRRDYSIVLCTDAFSGEDKKKLIEMFADIGFLDVHITRNGKRIYIGGSEVKKFLDIISNSVKISPQYEYKFSNKWKIRKETCEKV
jgi:hypothetical protein